ncbi:MAG: SDR family NAD(P)-dependent oxidoreductase [Anaerolineae bacterium]|nr:SDR family NAD(P)-dependent oxidoreductase [Anaerolineae bacterium]
MDDRNRPKTVLISGAAGGLGKAFASECAARGWDVVLVDANQDALPRLQVGMRRMFGVDVAIIACDLTNPQERNALWEQVRSRFGTLHGLINVAGLEYEGPFRERTLEELRTIIRLNIEATVENTHQALQLLPTGQHAFIINISSLAALYPMPVKAVYAASKRFLLNFSLALHQELKGNGIHVLALSPAGLPTHRAALQRIQSQGLAGQLTTTNVGTVAWRAIDHTLAGSSTYVPGAINRIIYRLAAIVPADLAASFVQRRFMKALHARRQQGLVENFNLPHNDPRREATLPGSREEITKP